jgi:large subunit ribosomal protein L19e
MNLSRKKQLASKVLKVGKKRIHFSNENLAEIKEAITKQDIKDLNTEGIITIKPIKGRKKIKKRKTKRGPGKIKKKIKRRKQTYVKITRKLREYLKHLKKQGIIDRELHIILRRKIRMRDFRSKAHLKEHLNAMENVNLNLVEKIKPKAKPKPKKVKKETKKTTEKENKKEKKK